ncbi:MAG: PIG-L family deacetylase [Anaerolineae bacterium]|nr:PIG-L family deacetylase [Anaerolineae bacterium]
MTEESTLPRGVMMIGAHPDDETIMVGGTLAMLSARGVPVYIVCATDGRGGESGGLPGVDSPAKLAAVRALELKNAAAALGAATVMQLGYEDPVIGPGDRLFGFAADADELATRIGDLIRVQGVDVVLTHGSDGEYGHPAHIQVHQAVLCAVKEQQIDVSVYGVAARVPEIEDRLWNISDPAHLALDITPWREAKIAAMECHTSQHELFKRRRKLKTVREALRFTETFHRHWPPVAGESGPEPELRDGFARAVLGAGGRYIDPRK